MSLAVCRGTVVYFQGLCFGVGGGRPTENGTRLPAESYSVRWDRTKVPELGVVQALLGTFLEFRAIWHGQKAPVIIMIPGSGPQGPEEMIPQSLAGDGKDHPLFSEFSAALNSSGVHTLALGKPGVELFSSFGSPSWFYDKLLYQRLGQLLAFTENVKNSPLMNEGIFSRGPIYQKTAKLQQPVYVFTGEHDMQTRASETLTLAEHCKAANKLNCKISIVPGVGHGFSPPKKPRSHPLLDMTLAPPDTHFLEILSKLASHLSSPMI